MMEEIRELSLEAKSVGLAVVMWSYPRAEALDMLDKIIGIYQGKM
jgi:class I fructose-bisphosphate aldolase